jgi:protein involved in polysaccharide export with SLBB domain
MRISLQALLCFLLWCGCASRTTVAKERMLVPGDCIVIDSAHREGLEMRHVVGAGGDISLPLLGEFHVAGLTLKQAELRIEKEYVDRGLFKSIDLIVSPCP